MSSRLLALLLAAHVAAFPAAAADRSYTVTDFTRIRVDGPYSVKLTTGVAPFAKVSGSEDAIDRLSVEVEGQTLVVRKDPSGWGGYPGEAPGAVEISVGTHGISKVWLNGSGSLKVNAVKGQSLDIALSGSGIVAVDQVSVDTLGVGLLGAGSAILGGTANQARMSVSGTSTLDAQALSVKDATIGADGEAAVKVTVTDTAKVNTQGMTTVNLNGKPSCTITAAGSAVVTGCR